VAKGDFKADPRQIIRANWRTYRDARTNRASVRDWLIFGGLPIAVCVVCLIFKVQLSSAASVGLLTVAGLLGTLLFGVLVELAKRAMDMTDEPPQPGRATSQDAIFIEELSANTAYASLMCIFAAIVFVVASFGTLWVARVSSALGLALGVHLVLVLMMVMKRVFALIQDRLTRARTGADRSSIGAGNP
jgi:magnesium-transporting ATPase (P-type)